MNRDDLIRMARETGVEWLMHNQFYKDHLQRFAALVAAAAKAEEREACAKRLEAVGCDHCAANIRARGQE